jgi:hypothetical protein
MVTMKLYCSICGRNDYYLERIETVAKKLNLTYQLEKITDEAAWKALDLEEACLFAYCPGCKTMHTDASVRNLPALEINGELRFWNVPATDEQLEACFAALC